jgi:hypothetical protein
MFMQTLSNEHVNLHSSYLETNMGFFYVDKKTNSMANQHW